eukprot:TRINITY_DN1680_c0_g1_i4.p1 TRINITY_DN1680_c0_g1~~TRINITY_DN1680_c0_g1_i4.p1  ORF type:complete len:156 (+),score=29.74 TRINITY_DN1680_c0_g1_i4:68-469(+)
MEIERKDSIELQPLRVDSSSFEASDETAEDSASPPQLSLLSKVAWKTALVLYSIVACDAVAASIVQPILPAMLEDQMHVSHDDVSFYCGLLIGLYYLSRAFSSVYLGHSADGHGRRRFLLVGGVVFANLQRLE